jgi:hypothetical protein
MHGAVFSMRNILETPEFILTTAGLPVIFAAHIVRKFPYGHPQPSE